MSAQRHREDIDAGALRARVSGLLDEGFRLALVAAHEDPDAMRVVYLLAAARPDRRVELVLRTGRRAATVPSLAAVSFPAGRFEREMRDLHGVVPTDHPLARRLVRHQHWPRGWYPMRAQAGAPPPFGSPDVAYPFLTVQGPGVYEVPVGPIHAGMIEPGHFRFSVVGEKILKLKVRLWFTHKGIEKLAEGRPVSQALPLAERVSGDTTVAHTLAFCLAVEEALEWPVPEPTQLLRAVLLELERLHNHVTDLGALCNDAGYGILNSHGMRIKERLLRLNADVTGHRLLRGGVVPGGARVLALPTLEQLRGIGEDAATLVELALGNSVVRDRFIGTAVLSGESVRDVGALGYVARASGVDVDARRDHPFHEAIATVRPVTRSEGDVMARFLVRAGEVQASIELLATLLRGLRPATIGTEAPRGARPPRCAGVGVVEGWRGTVVQRVELGADATVTRLKIVDPSFMTWPALPLALTNVIVPDFPLTNKSFNLSYAGNDL